MKATFPFEWRCKACRFEEWVQVTATGSDRSLPIDRGTWAGREALSADRARQDAWRAARMKLARRPCPRCGAIDTKTIVLTVGGSLLATSLTAILVIELLLLNLGVGFLMPVTLLVGAAGGVGIGAAVTAWLWRTRWNSSRWQLAPGGSRGG